MADSPASDDSVVTVINVEKQKIDDERYQKLEESRKKALTQHCELVKNTMITLIAYSDQWSSTDDHQKKKEIGTTLILDTMRMYFLEAEEISKNHNANDDDRLNMALDRCSECIKGAVKVVRGDVEPLQTTALQERLKLFRKNYGQPIQDENRQGYIKCTTPDLLTRILEDKSADEKQKRDQKKEFEQKKNSGLVRIFYMYQHDLIKDHESQVAVLEKFFEDSIAQ